MIPKGWSSQKLSSVASIIDCKHRTPEYVKSGIPLVSPGTIKWGALDLISPVKRVTEEEYRSLMDHCVVEQGDLVMSRNQSVGVVSYVDSKKPFVLGQDTVLIKAIHADWRFIYYTLQSDLVQRQIAKSAGGSTFSRINLSDIRALNIKTPAICEQDKISQILTAWDKAISVTEKLLTNSQQQKKALMQQLLTGKKRLLDENGVRFSGEWEYTIFGNLGDTYTGLTGKTKEDFGAGKPYIPYINIFKNSRIDIQNLEYVQVNDDERQSVVKYGDIFFTTSSETPEEVGMSSVLLEEVSEVFLNSFCFGFRLNNFETLIPKYARYLFRSEHVRRQISTLGQGVTRYNLSKRQLIKLELKLPCVEEQQKIAAVLSAADAEISTLEKKLTCLRDEKKALMQQLLTGKRRVKVDEAVAE
ncbi:TPA: restriction endonuclease subunit S [Escherichia coli]|nr:restriction endonuclease subunit S [Escherichia coli]